MHDGVSTSWGRQDFSTRGSSWSSYFLKKQEVESITTSHYTQEYLMLCHIFLSGLQQPSEAFCPYLGLSRTPSRSVGGKMEDKHIRPLTTKIGLVSRKKKYAKCNDK